MIFHSSLIGDGGSDEPIRTQLLLLPARFAASIE